MSSFGKLRLNVTREMCIFGLCGLMPICALHVKPHTAVQPILHYSQSELKDSRRPQKTIPSATYVDAYLL